MRSVFLLLLLANLLVIAMQFAPIRDVVFDRSTPARAPQLNAEKLRIIRDTSVRPAVQPSTVTPP